MSRDFWSYDEDYFIRVNTVSKWMAGWCKHITLWVFMLCLTAIICCWLLG